MRVLQMLEASRNVSCFADRIEYAIFAHASGIDSLTCESIQCTFVCMYVCVCVCVCMIYTYVCM